VESADPRGGKLEFEWNFVSSTFLGEKQEFEFTSTGTFKIKIFATSTVGTVGQTEIEFLVGERLENESDIFISKHRNGPTGVASLVFDEQRVCFNDRTKMPTSNIPPEIIS